MTPVTSYLAAAVDARNAVEAAAALTAHPASMFLSNRSIKLMAEIGFHGRPATERDEFAILGIAERVLADEVL